jgi:hypothetical protein
VVEPTENGRREMMSKAMGQAIRGHNLRVMMVIAALAAVLLVLILVAVVQTTSTTSDSGNPANPAMSADGSGGSSIAQDPLIERHAEVVARHHRVIPH